MTSVVLLGAAAAPGMATAGARAISGPHGTASTRPAGRADAAAPARPARGAASFATTPGLCTSWQHHGKIATRISRGIQAVLSTRQSLVAVRVNDPGLGISCSLRPHRDFDSASVVKATILAALLRKAHVQHRKLTARERNLAWLMITQSDNDAATALWNDVGMHSLQRFLDLAGMTETELGQNGFWGLTQITAHDEMILLKRLLKANDVLTLTAQRYELRLMANVIPSQRWGVTAGVPASYTIHVKNGWLPTPPSEFWWINSIGCFTEPGHAYSIVVLSWQNPTMAYGVTTVQDVAEVINRNLNPGATSVVPPSRAYPSWGIPDEQIPYGIDGR